MTNTFLKMLRCPVCGDIFEVSKEVVKLEKNLEWGIIHCMGCKITYPVAFGIPILKNPEDYVDVVNGYNAKNYTIQKDSLVKKIVQQIEEGKIEEVKRTLLFTRWPKKTLINYAGEKDLSYLDNKLTRLLPNAFVRIVGKKKLFYLYRILTKLSFQDLRNGKKEEKIFQKLMQQTSATGFIDLYFQLALSTEMARYFIHRFCTPRHLTTLSLLSVFPENEKPVLEIACGAGHIMHYFKERNHNQPIIGMDRTFAHLYMAKKFICPEGNFYCAEAEQKLPFQNKAFSGVYCSDAFPELHPKERILDEMKRVLAEDGVLSITRISSIPQAYYKTDAIVSAEQLKKHFKEMPHIVLDENDILDRYINKLGPDLQNERPLVSLNKSDWISIVASQSNDIFRVHDQFKVWPHALGHLNLNPLYHENGTDILGNKILRFEFPSTWYVNTNLEYMKYAPQSVHLSQAALNAIKEGKNIPEENELISNFVLMGLPKLFM